MIASATHLVAYQLEIQNVGKKAAGHFSDAFATNPWLTAIDDDMPIWAYKDATASGEPEAARWPWLS